MTIRNKDFNEMFEAMERFSQTLRAKHGRIAWVKGDRIDFPVSATRSQITRWSEAFHDRWKKRIDFAPRGRG